jgi:hypothetical protein
MTDNVRSTSTDRLATFGFIVGIVALLAAFAIRLVDASVILSASVTVLAIVAIVLGVVALARRAPGRGTAIAAIVLGAVPLVAPTLLDAVAVGFLR